MTDKPQQGFEAQQDNVSCETPESTETEQSGQDLLNEIMDRAMNKDSDPSEEEQKEESSSPDSPSPVQKNRRSSVYIYLAVLFGAAFLMLLLAYFVQQRNNDAVREDLRTTTASRQELLDEIERLEEENDDLQKDVDLYKYAADLAREQYENMRQENGDLHDEAFNVQTRLQNATALSYLERFINEGDYLMAALTTELYDNNFNERNIAFPAKYPPYPTQATRYMELRDWLEQHGHVVIKQTATDSGTSSEWPVASVALQAWENNENYPPEYNAARNLCGILQIYDIPEIAAQLTATFCHPDFGDLDALNEANFKPSTISMFEEVKADLLARGYLMEQDGILYCVKDGEPVEFNFGVTDIELPGELIGGENQASPQDEYE